MEAIIVVDMQNDFVYGDGALYVPSYEEERKLIGIDGDFVNNVVRYLKENEDSFIVYTEDKHPVDSIEFTVFPPHCIDRTPGQDIISDLQYCRNRGWKITKGEDFFIFSYSISTADKFKFLIDQMRYRNIKDVYLVGVAYDYCVGESAIAMQNQGFNTYVIKDLVKSVDKQTAKLMDKKLELYGVKDSYFISK